MHAIEPGLISPHGYVGFLNPKPYDEPGCRTIPHDKVPFPRQPSEIPRSDSFDLLATINLAGFRSVTFLTPILARQLTLGGRNYATAWDRSIRHLDWLEVWDQVEPGRFDCFPTARYNCLIRVECAQEYAAAALSYLITRVLDECVFMADFWKKEGCGNIYKPEVIGFAHVIQGTEHYALLLFDDSAHCAFDDVVCKSEGAVAEASIGDLVRSQPPGLARKVCRSNELCDRIVYVYLYLTDPLLQPSDYEELLADSDDDGPLVASTLS